jgi:hypothetical protein
LCFGLGAALCAPVLGQLQPGDYSHNWAPMHQLPNVAFSGPALFGLFTQGVHYPTTGDSIRLCYGFDSIQGGRNQSAGVFETPWFKLVQGYDAANAIAGVDIGAVSLIAATDSNPTWDPLVAPLLASPGNTGASQTVGTLTPGLVGATAGFPFPQVWEVVYQWTGPGVGAHGLSGPVTLGTDLGGGGLGNPLLSNLILQVEGPATGGPSNNQYYLASTTEASGTSDLGTGGVTNGNTDWAKGILGQSADKTGAMAFTRFTVNHPFFGLVAASPLYLVNQGDTEFAGMLAFQSPVLWATNDGLDGAGGTDWRASTAPASLANLRLLDQRSGGEGNGNLAWKYGASGSPAAAFDPSIVFNQSFFLWSTSSALSMPQEPTSWDDLGGALFPAQPGSVLLGAIATEREGAQNVPLVFDGLTAALLGFPGLSLGKPFTGSDDPLLDGLIVDPQGASHSSLFEGVLDPLISGVSTLSGGPFPIVSSPQPQLAGQKLGVAALGLQIRIVGASSVMAITEMASSLEIDLQ